MIKLEARKPWAGFEQLFNEDEQEKATIVYEALCDAGWTVKWTVIPGVTKEQHAETVVVNCLDKLSELHQPSHGVVQ